LTRTGELAEAVGGGHLHGAAALELLPVPAREAADYLIRCQVQPTPPAWQRLAEHLRTMSDSPVSAALDNPLMLTLVRDTFPGPGEVDDLLIPDRFTDRADVEAYLLDRVLPTAYRFRPGRPPAAYDPEQARRWLGFLASEMNRRDTRDLAWWQIRQWSPAPFRVVTMAIPSVLGFGITAGYMFGFVFGPGYGLVAGILSGLANGAAVGLAVGLRKGHGQAPVVRARRHRWSAAVRWGTASPGLAGGLAPGLVAGILAGVAAGPERGVVTALAAALLLGLAGGITETLLESRRSNGPRRLRPLHWRSIASRENVAVGAVFGLIFALALGLLFGLIGGLTVGLTAGLALGLAVTLPFGITNGLLQSSADSVSPMDPVTCWRRDRQSGLVEGLNYGLATGLGVGLTAGILHGVKVGLVVGIVVGIVGTVAFTIAVSQSWLATVEFLLLGRTDLFPSQGVRFLEDARERGVLRTVGSVYQFRHARLQDQLAAAYTGQLHESRDRHARKEKTPASATTAPRLPQPVPPQLGE
jgi:hypothetical protein